MPSKPCTICKACKGIMVNDVCTRCNAIRKQGPWANAPRKTTAANGYGWRWAEYSGAYRRQHPLCVLCEEAGRATASAVVDHIVEPSGPNDPLHWDADNHQALCRKCHEVKHGRQRVK